MLYLTTYGIKIVYLNDFDTHAEHKKSFGLGIDTLV